MTHEIDIETQLTVLLGERGSSLPPPDDAWDRLEARLPASLPDVGVDQPIAEWDFTPDEEWSFPLEDENEDAPTIRRWPVVLTGAGAAVVVILVLIFSRGDASTEQTIFTDDIEQPAVTTPQPTTPSTVAEPVTSPDSVVDSLGYRWSRVPHSEVVFGDKVPFTAGMNDVTVGGPGLVAVGQGDDGAAVWTSVDGITWSGIRDDAALRGDRAMLSVTSGGPGLVAIGWADGSSGNGDAAVWTSVDGVVWTRVPQDEAVFGGEPVSVIAGGPGLVAVGGVNSGDDVDAAVWTSVDGITWSRVPNDESVFGGKNDQEMRSVTVGGPGLVAVGSDGFLAVDRVELGTYEDFISRAAVWTSIDGITWSRVPADDAVFGGDGNQWMNAVTPAASGLLAVGGDWSSTGHHAAAWTSVDGITWSRVPNDDAVFGGEHDRIMLSATATGSGLVAVGQAWASSVAGDSASSVWTSADGITWSWLGYDEAVFGSDDNSSFLLSDGPVFTEFRQFMSSVIATDSGVVAVGADWSGPSHGAAVWVAKPEN